MSLSGKISSTHAGVPSWLVPRKQSKIVKNIGELSIVIGLFFVGFGIFSAGSADAKSVAPVAIVDNQPALQISFPKSIPTTTSHKPVAVLNNSNNFNTAKFFSTSEAADAIPVVKDEHVSFNKREEGEYRKGGRVKAGYLLPQSEIEWFEEEFIISHYTFALEEDPLYADDKKVTVPGLPEEDKFRSGFIFGGRGVIQQGTGVTEDGRYVSIDWSLSHHDPEDVSNNRWFFKYGAGRPVIPWQTVAVRHPDLPSGTRIVVENYYGQYEFIVGDNGLDLAENQIDIFVGNLTIAEADQLGVQRSRVGIINPVSHYQATAETEDGEITAEAESDE